MRFRETALVVVVMTLGVLAGPVLLLARPPGHTGAPVLVVGPPAKMAAYIEVAGGAPLGPEVALFGLLARSDAPDFVTALRGLGAWAVLDGSAVAALCGIEVNEFG